MYKRNSDPHLILVRAPPSRPTNIVDLFRQTFSSLSETPRTESPSPRSFTQSPVTIRTETLSPRGYTQNPVTTRAESLSPRSFTQNPVTEQHSGNDSQSVNMSSPVKRHLPDVRHSLSPSHGDKRGKYYGSAGDLTSVSRDGSPDRGQRLYGSSQHLDRRNNVDTGGKRKPATRSMTPDSRSILDKEVMESQNRKLQMEVSTLQTENKLLKDKHNRSQARIIELEQELSEAQDDLSSLQDRLNEEVSDLSARTRHEIDAGRDQMNAKLLTLTKENEILKAEVQSLEKQLDSSQRVTDMVRHNSEKTRTIEAYKTEITSLNEELRRVKSLLEQSERHLHDEEERHSAASKQLLQLTELKNALQQQSDSGGSGAISDKQLKSVEQRLKVTEERLHQERSDRANNLSDVEDKLLTENARLQATEKELTRQLHREKEKNRNFDHRVKQLKDDNEKLRLALPFDDATLTSDKSNYDIPYSSHSNQRAETMKHVSDDMNYILSQIEKQDGVSGKVDDEMVRTLWNKRELAYRQLREYEVQFQELHLEDNNIVDGLKNLRDTYGQAEHKLKAMEDQVEDMKHQIATMETTYKQQVSELVKERHNALARLKTAEDMLEALRAENKALKQSMNGTSTGEHTYTSATDNDSGDSLRVKVTGLESRLAQLTRRNELLEGESTTYKVQLEARNKALQDVQSELELAYSRLQGDEADDRKQHKIDKLSAQVNSLQAELKLLTDRYDTVVSEKNKMDSELTALKKSSTQKPRQQKTEQVESKVLQQLRDDLADREGQVTGLTRSLGDCEAEIQKMKQELYVEQMQSQELEAEVETLQLTVAQRAHMFETLSGSEREQLAQYQILKESLDNISQELAQKQAQIISLDINLSSQKDRTCELEEEMTRVRAQLDMSGSQYSPEDQGSALQIKVNELQKERATLKQELTQAYNAIKASEEQYRTLQSESTQLEQELVKEKTVVLQITAEKGEVEQHLEELAEEHDALVQEKTQTEEDLIKLETKLQEILAKYETEAKKQHNSFQTEYPNLPPEAYKVVQELEALRLMMEGKNRENDMLQDKLSRQHLEIEFLHRKVDLVHNDSIANREDVARMISELTLKMKEAVTSREVNQFLVGERTKLQNEKVHIEQELELERKNNDERKREINDVIHKIQQTESTSKQSHKSSLEKETHISNLETELRELRHSVSCLEAEKLQSQHRIERLSEDLEKLTVLNDSLEKRLDLEKSALSEEKNNISKWKENYTKLSHDHDLLRHDHDLLSDKHNSTLQSNEQLKKELESTRVEVSALQDELNTVHRDLEANRGQLLITKENVQKLTQDKGSMNQDYEGMCRSLTDKERQLQQQKERTEEKMDTLQKEYLREKVRLEEERNTAVQERDTVRKELENVQEDIKHKEVQLNSFGKTLSDLETVSREKKELEQMVHQLEAASGDSHLVLEAQRKEMMSLNTSIAQQQEKLSRLEAENHTVQADNKSLRATSGQEIQELQLALKELRSQHENERTYLNDNLAQTQTQLRKVETHLSTALNDKESLKAAGCLKDRSIEELQSKLSDESTGRRLAEQSVGSLRLQIEEARNQKNVSEARYVEMKAQVTKLQEQVKSEQDKNGELSGRFLEASTVSNSSQNTVRAKSEQIDILQKEVSKLKQMLESQKHNLTGKMKKANLDYQQQMEHVQEEKAKVMLQVQQLSADLDTVREHMASKNRDNLKLQEEILSLESKVRESSAKQKQVEETMRLETEKQSQISSRFQEQDEELRRLRTFLAKKVEESGEADKSMWHEMNRVIQDLSKQMQNHLDARTNGREGRDDSQTVLRYKKLLTETQGELSTERSLHQITKTSLQALEEDCQRLRHQLHALRRRDPPTSERKYKSRMEAINAIIARSQTQAQAILASSGYLDDSMMTPRAYSKVNFHSPRPMRAESPDDSFSEDLSIASLPPLHYATPGKK